MIEPSAKAIERVLIPLGGLFIMIHETITNDLSPELVAAAGFMMGLAAPAVRAALKRGGGDP